MITVDEVLEIIRKRMRNKLPDSLVLDGDTEVDRLGLSSLQIADIVFTIEDSYDFEFDLERAFNAVTVKDIVDVINDTLSEFQK